MPGLGPEHTNEVISAIFIYVAVLEMSQDERSPGDIADLARAGGDVLPCTGWR
jgi:hypothetical protein